MTATALAFLLIVLALAICPFWRRDQVFLPLYLWCIYCAVAHINLFGVTLLVYRWPMAILSAVMGLGWLSLQRRHPPPDGMLWLPLVLIGMAFSSTMWSELRSYTLMRSAALLLMYVFVFLGVRSLLDGPGAVWNVSLCLLVYVGIACVMVMADAITGGVQITMDSRFQGHLKATGVAQTVATSLPFLFWGMRHMPPKLRRLAPLFAPPVMLLLYVLLATRSRLPIVAALLTTPAAIAAMFRQGRHRTIPVAVAVGVAVVCAIAMVKPNPEARELLRIEDTDQVLRTRMEGRWDIMWEQAREHPFMGWGYGMVRYAAEGAPDEWSLDMGREGQIMTHNEHLALFYDLGIGPVLLFWLYLGAVLWRGLRRLHSSSNPLRDLLVAIWLSFCVDALNTFSHDGLMTIGNPGSTIFWMKGLLVYYGVSMLRVERAARLGAAARPPGLDVLARGAVPLSRRPSPVGEALR